MSWQAIFLDLITLMMRKKSLRWPMFENSSSRIFTFVFNMPLSPFLRAYLESRQNKREKNILLKNSREPSWSLMMQ